MKIIVLPQTADEFDDATDSDDQQQPGLGKRFLDEVDRYIRWIGGHAEVPRLRPGGDRLVNLKAFPHYIHTVQVGTIGLLAIAHAQRRPDYWIGRG